MNRDCAQTHTEEQNRDASRQPPLQTEVFFDRKTNPVLLGKAFTKMVADRPSGIRKTLTSSSRNSREKPKPRQNIISPGSRKTYLGASISMKRKCRQPSRKVCRLGS